MERSKLAYQLAIASWISVFLLTWSMLAFPEFLPPNSLTVGSWAFFFILAVCGTALSSEK